MATLVIGTDGSIVTPAIVKEIPSGATIETLTVTPTTSSQTITASGGVDGYAPITVNAVTSSIDPNITASNIKNGVTILGVTGTLSGGGSKYNVGDTVTADNGSTVGTVVGIFLDASKNKYAVIGLPSSTFATSLSMDNFSSTYFTDQRVWNNHTTATATCNEILGKGGSSAISHCRNYSYVIEGVTYYGQLPNIYELVMFFSMAQWISGIPTNTKAISCTSKQSGSNWYVDQDGSPYYNSGTSGYVMPILEIPFN